MPARSKTTETTHLNEDALRQRAYFLWEADGRPHGRGDHYWHMAHEEAHRAMVEDTATRTARITKGKNPSDMPPEVKAGPKAAKTKAKAVEEPKAKPAKKAKPVEAKPAKKEPKPRAAVVKPL